MTSTTMYNISCPHLDDLKPPRPDQIVHREECTQCFDSQDDPNGVDVCLSCFNGSCNDPGDHLHNHSTLHFTQTSHPLIMNIKRAPKLRDEDEPPKKLTKLEIPAEEPESERYDFTTTIHCRKCDLEIPKDYGNLSTIVPAVLSAQTMARQSDIQAYSFDLNPCEHVLLLQQSPNLFSAEDSSTRLKKCNQCDLQANLWLCLQCGNVACGRKQFGGEGLPGNSHALAHYSETHHPVAVKLGSITADGKADVYCYDDDDEIVDPELQYHLANWGIRLADVVVTEKSLAEMQLDLQYKYSFNMSTSTGEPLQPVFGPGLTGLQNLGNTCYVSSIIQALFSIPEWEKRYSTAFEIHPHECQVPYDGEGKGSCLECQMSKVANGLLSGRYSTKHGSLPLDIADVVTVHPDGGKEEFQPGIRPRMLKSLIGHGHAEFAGVKQQDAQEFLIWLLSRIQRQGKPTGLVEQSLQAAEQQVMVTDDGWGGYIDPTKCFKFAVQQRIQCLGCGGVKYRVDIQDNINITIPDRIKTPAAEDKPAEYEPVEFEDCIKTFTAKTEIDLTCSNCQHPHATMANGFLTLPDVLIVTASRFVLKNWVPTKVDVPLLVPETPIAFDRYIVPRGLQPGENPLPDDASSIGGSLAPLNEAASAQLQEMGFSAVRAEKALRLTGNDDAEVAMQWLFEHMDDPDIDVPYNPNPTTTGAVDADPENMNSLMGMGFEEHMARRALQETSGDMERAVDWLFSHPAEETPLDAFDSNANAVNVSDEAQKLAGHDGTPCAYRLQSVVMHKGSSVHAGHYVAFIRKEIPGVVEEEDWVLFNDEKVVRGGDWNEVYKTGYVFFFRRM